MNTPAHLIFNLTVLGKKNSSLYVLPVMIGALLPDVPMFIFYLVESLIFHTPNRVIWDESYFEPGWQNFIDCFNSIPIILVILAIAWKVKNQFLMLLCFSMLLHIGLDLPVHHDDGHHHFFPFLQWRFESPISYWDPRYFGRIVSLFEAAMVFTCCFIMFRRHKVLWIKSAAVGMFGLQLAEFALAAKFYL
jgi:hypothetical protein